MGKRVGFILFAFVAAISLLATACAPAATPAKSPAKKSPAKKVSITFGTCAPGGTWYPLGGAMATIIEKKTPYRCMAEATDCSIENTRLVGRRVIKMGITTGFVPFKAMKGKDPFKKKYPNIRCLMNIWGTGYFWLTRKTAGIKTLMDLKGKTVSLPPPADSGNTYARAMLKTLGIADEVKIEERSQKENVKALRDKMVDAILVDGAPQSCSAAIQACSMVKNPAFLDLSSKTFKKMKKKNPEIIRLTIPAGTYAHQKKPVHSMEAAAQVITTKKMSNEVAYTIVKAIKENTFKGKYALVDVNPAAKEMKPKWLVKAPYTYHSGAIKYYKEIGVWKTR